MLSDALVISLSRNFWDDVWRSRHQVMSRLARQNDVVFVSRPLQVDEAVPWAASRSSVRRAGAHTVQDRVVAYVPPAYLPSVFSSPAADRLMERGRRAALRHFVRRWSGQPRVLYLWHPAFERYLDTFPDSVVCYHLFDDRALYGDGRDEATDQALERIFARADLVFTASEELSVRYRRFGNVHWVPNGVDADAYERERRTPRPVPADLAGISGPRLGYAGTLRAQIDLDMLAEIATARPTWSLVLIGDISRATSQSAGFARLAALPNVYPLGAKPMEQIPAYMAHLDVGLLPYRMDGAAQFCYPLKMLEYLAAGLPVVSSRLSAVRAFEPMIRVAATPLEWIEQIAISLLPAAAQDAEARRAVAAANSWDARVARIGALIAERIGSRAAAPYAHTPVESRVV